MSSTLLTPVQLMAMNSVAATNSATAVSGPLTPEQIDILGELAKAGDVYAAKELLAAYVDAAQNQRDTLALFPQALANIPTATLHAAIEELNKYCGVHYALVDFGTPLNPNYNLVFHVIAPAAEELVLPMT